MYAPPLRLTAVYRVPLGPWTATTVAAMMAAPDWSATSPLIAAVVTPWPISVEGTSSATRNGSTLRLTHRGLAVVTASSPS